ncbi:MAG: ABC transporter ATP-binding protein [Clostridia bacterium]|nr:ABC transporter ATP-binding protein [Clostridia bacterium]
MESNAILEVKGLFAGYKEKLVLENVDLTIERGKIYSIIGPNGCGKTTLLRTMSRSLKPIKGKILLDGQDVFRTNTKKVARKMAILSQANNVMGDVTVKRLVSYGRYAHKEWWQSGSEEDTRIVEWAIRRTNLAGYEERKLGTLSGGERQRAWIAMSLAQKPEVLLLDEPTTYLDISHQLEVMELVASLNREEGITILMVLHDLGQAARYSDEMIVVSDRGIYKKGDPWEVLSENVLSDVFRIEAEVTRDEETGKPIFYAKKVKGG